MTLLVASVVVHDLEELGRAAQRAWASGADAVELRIDSFNGFGADLAAYLRAYLLANRDRMWIVTCRSREEGGSSSDSPARRLSRLIDATSGTDAYIDFEWSCWRRRDDDLSAPQAKLLTPAGGDHRLILSVHDLCGLPNDLAGLASSMAAADGAAVVKIAYQSRDASDCFAALDLVRNVQAPVIAIHMGEEGILSRVLAGKLGAFATFCSLRGDSATASGQLTINEMVNRYRFREIDGDTRVFGVIGDPVAQSMSPVLFNHWFAEHGVNAVYLPLRVRAEERTLERFLDACLKRPWLGASGFSVTMPHKKTALKWLSGYADDRATRIGAVNTLILGDDSVRGVNTDCPAAMASMLQALGRSREDMKDIPVDVLGAGGAARAVVAGLTELGCRVRIFGRNREKTRELSEAFGATSMAWEDRKNRAGEVLVNATSVGMYPDVDRSPMPPGSLDGYRLVFDLIYNPIETALIKEAKSAGATALAGLDMFVRQAALQFELWTGIEPDIPAATKLVAAEIEREELRQS